MEEQPNTVGNTPEAEVDSPRLKKLFDDATGPDFHSSDIEDCFVPYLEEDRKAETVKKTLGTAENTVEKTLGTAKKTLGVEVYLPLLEELFYNIIGAGSSSSSIEHCFVRYPSVVEEWRKAIAINIKS